VRRSYSAVLLLLALAASAPQALAKPRDPGHEITSQIICPCSCGEVLSGCTCETGKSMQATVENGIKAGKSKKAIVDGLVAQYGEVIRGAPKPEGFNLIVWIAPFAATLAGFVLATWILRRWVKRRGAYAVVVAGPATEIRPDGTIPFPSGQTLEGDFESPRARAEEELRELRLKR
jgi:cytochrome c-type biogenesis protein CcmH/NrfF